MSSTGQLIPKYRHPSETVFIYDNTVVTDTSSDNSGVRMTQVFASPKGRDNVLLEKKSLYAYVEEYGYPDFRRYGQPGYMPYAALATNYATCWCMRIMPDNAAYANVFLVAKIKTDTTDAQNPKLVVKFVPLTRSGLNDGSLFASYMATTQVNTPDTDGFITYPIMGFRALGRGVYGEYYRVRISHDIGADKTNTYANYALQLISTETSTQLKETFNVAFGIDSVDAQTGLTLYAPEVVNDIEGNGSQRIAMEFMYDNISAIFDYYKKNVDPDTTLTVENFDIFGYDRTTGTDNTHMTIDGGASSVGILSTDGLKLASGDDGDFADTATPAVKEAALEKLYDLAYTAGIDTKMKSKYRAPKNLFLDANYPVSTKKAMANLALTRKDGLAYLDSGLLNTVKDIETYFTQLNDIDTYMVSKNAGMFKVADPVTNKAIPVTITMWLAAKIPTHWNTRGKQTALAAEDYAKLSGYIKNSVKPEIDSDDEDIKEIFYDARWNYIECIGENTFVRGTQQTSQTELSDLSEESNVHVMLQIKNMLERLCAKNRYKFGEASDRKRYQDDANELFSSYKGTMVRSIAITYSMSAYEEKRSIIHCNCAITYMTLIKRTIIEIDINPRA